MTHSNPRSGQFLRHGHSHITRAVAAMDSYFGLQVRSHQQSRAESRTHKRFAKVHGLQYSVLVQSEVIKRNRQTLRRVLNTFISTTISANFDILTDLNSRKNGKHQKRLQGFWATLYRNILNLPKFELKRLKIGCTRRDLKHAPILHNNRRNCVSKQG